MVGYCALLGCSSSSRNEKDRSFFRFSKDEKRKFRHTTPILRNQSMNTAEAKVPNKEGDWQSIEIYLFSNGQQYSPPRKYHLRAEELNWWDATLNQLARSHYGIQHPLIYLYTTDGRLVEGPLELRDGMAYVAVVPSEEFIDAGYEKYLIRASRSWEKRQARKSNPACEHEQPCCLCPVKDEAPIAEYDGSGGHIVKPVLAKADAADTGEYGHKPVAYVPKPAEYGPKPADYGSKLAEYGPGLDKNGTKSSRLGTKIIEREASSGESYVGVDETRAQPGELRTEDGDYTASSIKSEPRLDKNQAIPIEYGARPNPPDVGPGTNVPWYSVSEPVMDEMDREVESEIQDDGGDSRTSLDHSKLREDELPLREDAYRLPANENKNDQRKPWVDKYENVVDEQLPRSNESGKVRHERSPRSEQRRIESSKSGVRVGGKGTKSGENISKSNKHEARPGSSARTGKYSNKPQNQKGKLNEHQDKSGEYDFRLRTTSKEHLVSPDDQFESDEQEARRMDAHRVDGGEHKNREIEPRNIEGEHLGSKHVGQHPGRKGEVGDLGGKGGQHEVRPAEQRNRATASNLSGNRAERGVRAAEQKNRATELRVGDHGPRMDDLRPRVGDRGSRASDRGGRPGELRDRDGGRSERRGDHGTRLGEQTGRGGERLGRAADIQGIVSENRGRVGDHGTILNGSRSRATESGAKVGAGSRDGEPAARTSPRARDREPKTSVSSGVKCGKQEARASPVGRGGEARARVGSGGRSREPETRAIPGSRGGEPSARVTSGGRSGELEARAIPGSRGGEPRARVTSGGRSGEPEARAIPGRRGVEPKTRVDSGGKSGETEARAIPEGRGGEPRVRVSSRGRSGEPEVKVTSRTRGAVPRARVSSGGRNGETGARTSSGGRTNESRAAVSSRGTAGGPVIGAITDPRPVVPCSSVGEPVNNLFEPEHKLAEPECRLAEPAVRGSNVAGSGGAGLCISEAPQHVRRVNMCAEIPTENKRLPSVRCSMSRRQTPYNLCVPQNNSEDIKTIQSNRNKGSITILAENAPACFTNGSTTFNEVRTQKIVPKYPQKCFAPPAVPPPTADFNQIIIERKSNSLIKITSNHKSLATDSAPIENVIGDKEIIVVSTNLYRNPESEITSVRLDSGRRHIIDGIIDSSDETQTEQISIQQSNASIPINEEVQTYLEQEFTKMVNRYGVAITTNSKIELSRTESCQRDNMVATDDPEENYISIINKGDVVNLKLNIEVRNAERSGNSCQRNGQRSRSLTNVTRTEKESQISFDDDMYVQSKSLQSLLNNECFHGCGFEGRPKVVVVQCACCAHGLKNPPRCDNSNDSKKYVLLVPSSQQEDSDDKCCCEPACHSYGQKTHPQLRKHSIYIPVKKTVSNMSLETTMGRHSGSCDRRDIHIATTTSSVQTEDQKSEISTTKRKVSITEDSNIRCDYKRSLSQITMSQTQFVVTKDSNCLQACQEICSQVPSRANTQAGPQFSSQTCEPNPTIQLQECALACPLNKSQECPLACPQKKSQECPLACPQNKSQECPLVCPQNKSQECPLACPQNKSQECPLACPQNKSQECPLVYPQNKVQECPLACPQNKSQECPLACPQNKSQECPQACPQSQLQDRSQACPQAQSRGHSQGCPQIQSQGLGQISQLQTQAYSQSSQLQTQGYSKSSQLQTQGYSQQVCPQICPQVCPQVCPQACPQAQSQVCLQTCPKICPQACPQAQSQECPQKCPQAQSQVCNQAYLQLCPKTCPQACPRTQSQVCPQTCPQAQSQVCPPQTLQVQSQIQLQVLSALQGQSQALQVQSQALHVQSQACSLTCPQICPQVRSQRSTQIRAQTRDAFTQTDWCFVLLEARCHDNGRYSFHLPPLNVLRYYTL